MLISTGAWAHGTTRVSSNSITGALVATGVFVVGVACFGYYGATKHHVAILFFYMVIMAVIIMMQFIIACVSLSLTGEDDRKDMLEVLRARL